MKQILRQLLLSALEALEYPDTDLTPWRDNLLIEPCKDSRHGDYAANIAMQLAKPFKQSPMRIAEQIVKHLPQHADVEAVAIAPPGFINFKLRPQAYFSGLDLILSQRDSYGQSDFGQGERILLEFVSANPTGPLHIGHGRGAVYGDTLASLLKHCGFKVHREYYVNDAGRQMDILACSVWLRYLELQGESFTFPSNGYRGEYIIALAEALRAQHQKAFLHSSQTVFADLPLDEQADGTGDKEAHIDALVERAKQFLGENYPIIFDFAESAIREDIREDLECLGVVFDQWFSERSLQKDGSLQRTLDRLQQAGHLYEKEGALWFRATAFGDEKDRVLVRKNGQFTYFATDASYHFNKFTRGFDRLIDIIGSDHHGYVARIKAVVQALGYNSEQLEAELVQFATLYRGTERVQMSTRSGSFVTLRELREEVGKDATRFFYIIRKCDQHLDFDIELAKSRSNENPVYYIQYAHARICSVFRQYREKFGEFSEVSFSACKDFLATTEEKALAQCLQRYPEMLNQAAKQREPHQVALFLRDIAQNFHSYYNAHAFLVEDTALRQARLNLVAVTQIVLANGLRLLGISAPLEM